MENRFSKEQFYTLYNLEFSYFINFLVKQNSDEMFKQCNFKISDLVTKYSYDPIQDNVGMHRWLDGMAKDTNIYDLDIKTIEVRKRTHDEFALKIKKLIDMERFFDFEVTDEITEIIFLKNSLNVYLNIMKERMGL